MQAATVLVDAISGQAVIGDGHQWPQKGQVRPQPVMGTDMRALQLPGAGRPQAFAGIVGIPDVKITHLWPDRCGNSKHMPSRDMPCAPSANRHLKLLDQRASVLRLTNSVVKRGVHLQSRAFADLIGRRVIFEHDRLLAQADRQGSAVPD